MGLIINKSLLSDKELGRRRSENISRIEKQITQIVVPEVIGRIVGDGLEGIVNGINTFFITNQVYIEGSISVYLNGLRLTRGSGKDFTEGGSTSINMENPPEPGSVLMADYNILT